MNCRNKLITKHAIIVMVTISIFFTFNVKSAHSFKIIPDVLIDIYHEICSGKINEALGGSLPGGSGGLLAGAGGAGMQAMQAQCDRAKAFLLAQVGVFPFMDIINTIRSFEGLSDVFSIMGDLGGSINDILADPLAYGINQGTPDGDAAIEALQGIAGSMGNNNGSSSSSSSGSSTGGGSAMYIYQGGEGDITLAGQLGQSVFQGLIPREGDGTESFPATDLSAVLPDQMENFCLEYANNYGLYHPEKAHFSADEIYNICLTNDPPVDVEVIPDTTKYNPGNSNHVATKAVYEARVKKVSEVISFAKIKFVNTAGTDKAIEKDILRKYHENVLDNLRCYYHFFLSINVNWSTQHTGIDSLFPIPMPNNTAFPSFNMPFSSNVRPKECYGLATPCYKGWTTTSEFDAYKAGGGTVGSCF